MQQSPATLAASLIVAALALIELARTPATPAGGAPAPTALRSHRPAPSPRGAQSLRDGEPLDLNLASVGDLIVLPGVGPKLAERIVRERERRAGFASVDELRSVSGVGAKKLEKLRPWLRVGTSQIP